MESNKFFMKVLIGQVAIFLLYYLTNTLPKIVSGELVGGELIEHLILILILAHQLFVLITKRENMRIMKHAIILVAALTISAILLLGFQSYIHTMGGFAWDVRFAMLSLEITIGIGAFLYYLFIALRRIV